MKLVRITLAIIISLVLVGLISPAVQAEEESGSVDLSATVPLTISDVSASSIGYYGATISWKTNGNATSQVFYDTVSHDNVTGYYYHTIETTSLVSNHSITLTGLSLSTTYHYRVRSVAMVDGTEFVAVSDDFTFTTLSPPPPTPPVVIPPALPPGTTDVRGKVSLEGVFTTSITATSEDRLCTLTISAGTVGLTKELEPLTEITMVIMDKPPPPPEDANIIGLAYTFGPDGATFNPPLTLTWSYDPNTLPTGVAEEDLVIAYYDATTGKWVELPCVVNPVTNTITASVSHFTTFAIIGTVTPPTPPEEEEEVVPPEEEVVPPEEEVVPPEEEEIPPAKPINWPLVGGIIGGWIVVGLLIFFWIRRRA